MIRTKSIRFYLTFWYLIALASGLVLFGTGTWLMLRSALLENGASELERQISAVQLFLNKEAEGSDLSAVREEAREYSTGLPQGQGFRLWDRNEKLLLERGGASGR